MLLLVVFVALFAGGIGAQNGAKRTVLFTLGENEEIESGEYFVMQKVNQNRFACIVLDTIKKTRTLVFNGKRVMENAVLNDDDVRYLNINEENGYVVDYRLQNMRYVNMKGEVYGPFDYIEQWNGHDKFIYRKTRKDYYYVYARGVTDGPFDKIDFSSGTSAYADCEYLYSLAGRWYAHYGNGSNKMIQRVYTNVHKGGEKWYVNINGVKSRGYDEVYNYRTRVTESGKYAYAYKENGKWHVNINGEESKGYDHVSEPHITESGKYAYVYRENGWWHVNINGEESKEYNLAYGLYLTKSGKYAYQYKKYGEWYVNINGEEIKSYERIRDLCLTESGKYFYMYHENGKSHVNINGKESEGYNLKVADNDSFSFYYNGDNGKLYKNNNGEKIETEYLSGMRRFWQFDLLGNTHCDRDYNDRENLEIYSTDRNHTLYSSYEHKYEYVVIDGVRCGAAPALYAWYDKGKNAFVWNAVEGRELVLYEYGF
jgi:hypothetical protein